MTEQGIQLSFTNLSPSLEWKDYHNLFSEFGKIGKLYIEPNGKFGRVHFDDINDALRALQELNGKLPYNLNFDTANLSSQNSKTLSASSSEQDSLFSIKMASKYEDISAYEGTENYVDVFGRVLDTFESEDGEIYVPVRELKKSGFEIFLAGTLPKQGQLSHFDDHLYQQYENYLQIKATKFVMRNNLKMPEEKVSHIFAKLKQTYMNYHRTSVTNKNGMLTVSSSVTSSPRQQQQHGDLRTTLNNRSKSQLRSPYSMESVEDTLNRSRARSNTRNSEEYSDRQFNSNVYKGRGRQNNELFNNTQTNNVYKGRGRNNNNSRESFGGSSNNRESFGGPANNSRESFGGPTNNSRESFGGPANNSRESFGGPSHNSRESFGGPSHNSRESFGGPSNNNTNRGQGRYSNADRSQNFNKPRQSRSYNNNKRETNESNVSTNIRSPSQNDNANQSFLNSKEIYKSESPRQEKPATLKLDDTQNIKPSLRPPNSVVDNKPELKPHTVTFAPEVIEKTRSSRKTIVGNVSTCGLFQCTKILTNDTFVGAAMPTEYAEQVCTLEEIANDIKPDPSFKPTVGDLVAAPKDDFYARGIVVSDSNSKYECAFIDFGTSDIVDKVFRLPDKYKDIPEFACLCRASPETVQELSKKMGADVFHPLEIKKPFSLTVKIEETGNSFELHGSQWDPIVTSKPVIKKEQKTYHVQPSKHNLQTDEVVMITAQEGGWLLVRTKEASARLKQVAQEINSLQAESLEKEPEVNQMVVSSCNTYNYRAKVVSVENSNAFVHYIDYGNSDTVATKELKNVSETLANIDHTLLRIKLQGFVDHQFSSKALAFLNECCEKKEKLTAVAKGDDIFDLIFKDKTSLSEKLVALDMPDVTEQPPSSGPTLEAKSTSPKDESKNKPAKTTDSFVKLTDIPECKLEKGKNTAMCLFTGDLENGIVTFCLADDESTTAMADLTEKIKEYVAKDDKPYHPQKREVCLASFEGEWFRAVYLLDSEDKYGMFYCDYGNTQSTSANDLRKMPKDIANIRCCAAFCTLEGLPYEDEKIKESVLVELKDLLQENEIYEIEAVEETEGCYFITIPSVYSALKQKGLL